LGQEELADLFRASDKDALRYDIVEPESYLLLAVNELPTNNFADFEQLLQSHVLLDSGVYVLASQHADRHSISMDEALCLAPQEIEGFEALFDLYVEIVTKYESRLWGYVEIDFGGCTNKRRTRARLESLGLRPMPVYHPLNDGWDYFDELAQEYDRKEPTEAAGYNKARQMASYNAILLDRSYRIIKADLERELSADVGLFDHDHGEIQQGGLPPVARRPAAPQVPP